MHLKLLKSLILQTIISLTILTATGNLYSLNIDIIGVNI